LRAIVGYKGIREMKTRLYKLIMMLIAVPVIWLLCLVVAVLCLTLPFMAIFWPDKVKWPPEEKKKPEDEYQKALDELFNPEYRRDV
jgi:hypothetical protein